MMIKYQERLFDLSSINHVEAFADYVQIYTSDIRYTVLSTVKSVRAKLGEADFLRVRRSFMVALNKIESLKDNELEVGNKMIELSHKYKKELKEKTRTTNELNIKQDKLRRHLH